MTLIVVETWQHGSDGWGGSDMSLRSLRRRYRRLVRELDLPTPFDIGVVCEHLSRRRGRPIRLLPMSLSADGPCGLWVATATTDYVVVESDTTGPHRDHIILHEISHLLLEHDSVRILTDDATRRLMPHLDPTAIQRLLGRSAYDAAEEREAEFLASLLHGRLATARPPELDWEVPQEVADVVARLGRSLEAGRHRG